MVYRSEAWPEGTPCWADLMVDEVQAAVDFYSSLFGWEIPEGPADMGGYRMCMVDGRTAAALSPKPPGYELATAWSTYLAVDDLDSIVAKSREAGATFTVEPVDIGSEGRFAVGTDPAGASFGLWQAGNMVGFQVANQPGSCVWNQQMSGQYADSLGFYAAILDYSYQDISGGQGGYSTMQRAGDGETVGGIGEQTGGEPARWDVYFMVDDCDDAVAKVRELGGTVTNPPYDTPFGRMADVAGPQGETFSLMASNQASEGDTLG